MEDSHLNLALVPHTYEILIYHFHNSEESPTKKREPGMTSPNGRMISLAKAGNLEEIENLLNGSVVNVNHAEWNGDTAIAMASSFGHLNIVRFLIGRGADVNSKDKKGESALMLACNKGFVEVARLLLEHGAYIDNQSKVGYTALMGATMNGSAELIQLLVDKGATLDLKNNAGKIAADFAKTDEVRELLRTRGAPMEGNSPALEAPSPTSLEASENTLSTIVAADYGVDYSSTTALVSPPPPLPCVVTDPSMKSIGIDDTSEREVAPQAPDIVSETSAVARPAVGLVPFTKPPPPRRGSSSPVPPSSPLPPPLPSAPAPAPVTAPLPASSQVAAPVSTFSQETVRLPLSTGTLNVAPSKAAEEDLSDLPASKPSETASCPAQAPPPVPVPPAPPAPSTPAPYILSNGQADPDEHEQVPKRIKVSEMYSRLVLRCEEHVKNEEGESRFPYDVLLRRLQQLQTLYDGAQGLVESARIHEQECVVEYYALHFEKAQQEALRVLEPLLRRSILTLNVGPSEQKTLTKFAEIDEALTQCSQELMEALEALGIEALTSALQRLPRLGPSLAYCFYEHDARVAQVEENEAGDLNPPLLQQQSAGWASRLAASLSAPGKDGKLRMFNLSRPVVAGKLRRKPSWRKFVPEVDPSVHHLLPLYAGLMGQWGQAFSAVRNNHAERDKETYVVSEGWFEPQQNPVAKKQQPLEANVRAAGKEIPKPALPLPPPPPAPQQAQPPPPPRPPRSPAPGPASVPAPPTIGPSTLAPLALPGQEMQSAVAAAVAKRTPTNEPAEPSSPVPPAPPARSPKRIDNSLFAALGNFDPSKPPPRGGTSPLRNHPPGHSGADSPVPRVVPAGVGAAGLGGSAAGAAGATAGGAADLHSTSVDSNTSLASPQSVSSSTSNGSSIQSNNNLDRAVAKPRRAPTKKKFETKIEDLPPVPVVPIAIEPDFATTPVTKQHKGGIWKAIFGSNKSANTSTKSASGANASASGTPHSAPGTESGVDTPSLVHPSSLHEDSAAPSPCTPKTPASGSGGISGIFTTLGLKSKKSKKNTTTLSPALTESNLSDNMRHLQGGLDMMERVSESSLSGVHHGMIGTASKVVVQNVALAGVQLPIVGAAAVLMLQLIDLCDAYKCNMKLFLALKARMQFLYRLYFAEGGVADVAHQKGKDSVVEPFARHLEMLILDAIVYLTAFTEKGFFHKLLSGRRPQQRFAEIDADITKCLDGLTVALQLLHIADLTATLDALQVQKTHQEVVYEVVTDIQRRVDRIGGLHGVKSMRLNELQALCVELGVRDAIELRDEIDQCEERLEDAAEHVSETVYEVKNAVSGADQNFTELKDMVSHLQDDTNSRKRTANSVDLDAWRPKETPQIDRKHLLGSGSFGYVFGGVYLGRQAAFKVPNSHVTMGVFAANSFPELQREVRLHLKVNACPGVVRILAVALQADEICAEPCVIMERAIGSLYDFLHKSKHRSKFLPAVNFSLTGKLTLALQVAAALEYISSAGLIHRDIKASNVLLFYEKSSKADAGREPEVCAKISDFGLSRNTSLEGTVDLSSHISVKGTPSYLAPEAFNAQYSVASDVFAFGILLNEILTEKLPVPISVAGPNAPNIFQLKDAVCRDQHRPSLYAEEGRVGDALRRLITRCWSQEPDRRCGFAQITVELTNILHAAVTIAKYGSAKFEQGDLAAILSEPAVSMLSRHNSRASVTTTMSAYAFSAHEENTTTAGTATTLGATSVPSSPAASSYAPPPDTPTTASTVRPLEELSVEEVGALMEAIQMHPLKEVLVSHRVSGLMLTCVETVDDLLSIEYGLQSRGLAGGLMKKINDWKLRGVPSL